MAQLRHDYSKFEAFNCEVLVMVPNGPRMIERYLRETQTPYPILTDKGSQVASVYMQLKRLFKIGSPTVILVNRQGKVAYAHYAASLIEEPDNNEALTALAKLSPAAES